jgi:hypothetical protein
MRPFAQTESGKTTTALTVTATEDSPMYAASIQQTPVREKINAALSVLNGGASSGVL